MLKNLPPIYFYIPPSKLPAGNLPQNAQSFWQWLSFHRSISPMAGGGCIWTLQTYLYLNDRGFPCQLVQTMPDEGIVLSHRDFLDDSLQPSPKLLIVCLRADVDRHPYAQLHVVQNPYQAIPRRFLTLWESYFIPHWTQSSLIPRDPQRGDTFENVAFIGNETNLVSEFRGQFWHEQLDALGLRFQKKLLHDSWHDYSDLDVVLAVREFGRKNYFRGKPASKLYNAWHAGVPAILGYESAFRAERKSDLDYLEATSLTEVISSLKRLRDNKEMRRAMVENGWIRAKETQSEQMVAKWQTFLIDSAIPAYKNWCSMSPWQQQVFFNTRRSFLSFRPSYYFLKSQVFNFVEKTVRGKSSLTISGRRQ
ncbi:hypothetical protein C7Y66_19770 [Chroococcidiopsis sp. CCALA 051]|uniref:hypothetical protein n=1 Tax=Chroococcidiopsis sp. CCALA 051 TaxID=869949 RepID=UPI000D0E23F5|nr:hypothetical protein [Chroococcidiopsis sp. CCALA 051]PSM47428.1 hypothetical protein C7Y66_19770 [Chroococcidiopsis sp. CCALA 051]